jgi:hypothetical protein
MNSFLARRPSLNFRPWVAMEQKCTLSPKSLLCLGFNRHWKKSYRSCVTLGGGYTTEFGIS